MPVSIPQNEAAGGGFIDAVTQLSNGSGPAGFPWDTSDPFFSAYTRDLLKTVFKCYIRQIICLVGVPVNIICCMVFLKQGLVDKVNLLLFALAVADVANLGTMLLFFPTCYLKMFDSLYASNWDTIVNTKVVYVNRIASFVSGTLIVILSLDRCLSVVFPLKAGRILTFRPMLIAIILTYLILFVCYFPSLLVYAVRWRLDPSTNRSMAYTDINRALAIDNKVSEAYTTIFHLVMKPVSITIVVACSTITIIQLQRASQKRLELKGNVKKEDGANGDSRITQMLLVICVAYVVLIIPEMSASILYSVVPGFFFFQKYHNSFSILFDVVIFNASCLNSAVNFFAYVSLSSKFRKTLRDTCKCGQGK
ncbi:hypothetical protein ACOMHN_013969 [Nucella lapillus]